MALNPVRADLYSPMFAKNFASNTAAVLHSTDAPGIITHLPCGVIATTAASLVWKDASGTQNTTALAAGVYTPIAISELVANAGNPAVTIFWNAEP